jgi:hypothetical protein
VLTFKQDGTFRGDGIPFALFTYVGPSTEVDWSTATNFTGTWSVGGRNGTEPFLNIRTDRTATLPSVAAEIDVSKADSQLALYFFVGPPDDNVRFEFVKAK